MPGGLMVNVVSYRGGQIQDFLPEIARLRMEVFREYPYLYIGDEDSEKRHLRTLTMAEDALVVLALDGKAVVGAATGLPLSHETDDLKDPFLRSGKDPEKYFYFAEMVLQKAYRGKGIGSKFFDALQQHVFHLRRFSYTCFCTVKRPEIDPKRPSDYRPLDGFLEKRGYKQHPEMIGFLSWQEIDETLASLKQMIFWIKRL